jgi:hypothetical protein
VHRELNRTNPKNPFLFSTILNSFDPFAIEKRKDLASTKKWLSIPKIIRQPPKGSRQLLHLKAIYMAANYRKQAPQRSTRHHGPTKKPTVQKNSRRKEDLRRTKAEI